LGRFVSPISAKRIVVLVRIIIINKIARIQYSAVWFEVLIMRVTGVIVRPTMMRVERGYRRFEEK
jgi:hypothetical protein